MSESIIQASGQELDAIAKDDLGTDAPQTSFSKASKKMIATNDGAYQSMRTMVRNRMYKEKDYNPEQIANIIASGNLTEQQDLSRAYFYKDGYYKHILCYYANLLTYAHLLSPNPGHGKTLSTPHIEKRYYQAMDFVDRNAFNTLMQGWMLKALTDGCYYGVKTEADKNSFVVLDLPAKYCISRFKDVYGNDIIEFDLSYFNSITNADARKAALTAYPKAISKAYKSWNEGKRPDKWFIVPSDIGICFPFFDGRPPLLNVIPASIRYDEAVETERAREEEEIRKILVQQIPHLSDGRLLFEPDEAEEIHAGSVGMLRQEQNISVLTTYGQVSMLSSKTSSDNVDGVLKLLENDIYAQGGPSKELFASTGSGALDSSKKVDLAFIMPFATKMANFLTKIINGVFSNSNISFKFIVLPVTWQNQSEYLENSFKLVGLGYSVLIPAITLGINQKDLVGLKELENDVLKLGEKLIPLSSSYTQTNSQPSEEEDDKKNSDDENPEEGEEEGGQVIDTNPKEGGRPTKKDGEKTEKTVANEESKK